MRTVKEIRSEFLEFFAERGHRVVPSAPLIPQGDPTLLFTNAGMNQFKDVFLGSGTRDYKRAADTQKCLRVSGKHNDLEEVGIDTYHHTFFEMLGNWSFGDYFKEEAIAWAWELLVDRWGLDPGRIYATVFAGDPDDGMDPDVDSEEIWPRVSGLPAERILRFDRKDNFWEMGDTGPCGPCTEIHYDRGDGSCDMQDDDGHTCAVNAGCARYIELWNLVFIEFNRGEDGSLSPLPAKHVDTGMGLERITAVLQEKDSNYATDLFTPIFERINEVAGVSHGGSMSPQDVACRVIADHVRTLAVAFADGALPNNEGRGYVLRRILRRAARFGRQALGQETPFIHRIVPAVVDSLGDVFPEIQARQDHIAHLIESEEEAFAQTLDRGLTLYTDLADKVRGGGSMSLPGEEAFDLYATYGFPRDLVELMAREDGLSVDAEGWQKAESAHKDASRAGAMFSHQVNPSEFEGMKPTTLLCHQDDGGSGEAGFESAARVVRIIADTHLVLDQTPFYPEGGGQVGDAGVITGDGFRFRVDGTGKQGDVVVHVGEIEEGDADSLPDDVVASVDADRRRAIMANHTGTHLLHWALREVLGEHATQQGSLVAPDRLRFDVTHPQAVTQQEIDAIERMVNGRIAQNVPLGTTVEDLEDARSRGVTALFGEKYDDTVRVVDIGGFSTELCGGTHCRATGDIGTFMIVSESAVQAGVRRIEAVTSKGAILRMQAERTLLRGAATVLRSNPEEIVDRVESLQKQVKELKKAGDRAQATDGSSLARKLMEEAEDLDGVKAVIGVIDVPAQELAMVADVIRNTSGSVCGVLMAPSGDKIPLVSFASKDLAGGKIHAGELAKEVAGILGGSGGGRPDFAQAGGRDASKLDAAVEAARNAISRSLNK